MRETDYKPMSCELYPKMAEIAKYNGYVLAISTLGIDLIFIPWAKNPGHSKDVVNHITKELFLTQIGEPELKIHNRMVYTLCIGQGERSMDLSFMKGTY